MLPKVAKPSSHSHAEKALQCKVRSMDCGYNMQGNASCRLTSSGGVSCSHSACR